MDWFLSYALGETLALGIGFLVIMALWMLGQYVIYPLIDSPLRWNEKRRMKKFWAEDRARRDREVRLVESKYSALIEVPGCSPEIARRIIKKLQKGEELTLEESSIWYDVWDYD